MKQRLDVLLVEHNLAISRERAKATIMAGIVYVNGEKVDKPGTMVDHQADITVRGSQMPYVSRGGLKLEKALAVFSIDVSGKTVADIGASTGGFTDCALQKGAARVFAIDVGYGQLAWSLRNDGRVVSMERTNIRAVTPEDIGTAIDLAVIDVSFISLAKVLPVVHKLLAASGVIVALIKPQFEAGRDKVGKKGVVRDSAIHRDVIRQVLYQARQDGLYPQGLTFSPVKGPEGNIEYLAYFVTDPALDCISSNDIDMIVAESHAHLPG